MIDTSLHPDEPVMLPRRSFSGLFWSAVGYSLLLALMFRSGMSVFVPAVLIYSSIRHGRRFAWIVLIAAIAFACAWISVMTAAAWMPLVTSVTTIVMSVALPTMVALPWIERGEAFGRALMLLVIVSAAGLVLTEVGIRAVASFSPHAEISKELTKELAKTQAQSLPAEAARAAERVRRYFGTVLIPAWLLTSGALSYVLSLLMIGRLRTWREFVAKREPAVQNAYLLRNLVLPDWVLFAFILGGLAPLAKGMLQAVAANLLVVAVFLYMVQGFALLRFLLANVGVGFVGSLFAFGFVFVTIVGPFVLAVAGLFDPFFDFRHFKKRKDDSHESHSD